MGEPARTTPADLARGRDPALEWVTAHPEEVSRHRGRRIAVDPVQGILASAPTPEGLLAELDRLGVLADEQVLLLTVPAW